MAEISATLKDIMEAGAVVPIIFSFNFQIWLNTNRRWILEDESGQWQTQPNSSFNSVAMSDVISLLGEINTALDIWYEASGIKVLCIHVRHTVVCIYILGPELC